LESLLEFKLWTATIQQIFLILEQHHIEITDQFLFNDPIMDFIPISGASSLVLLFRGVVIKIYTAKAGGLRPDLKYEQGRM
jgi:hypothetical protein